MIQLDNFSFSYGGKRSLYENLNLRFQQGNIYGLLGKNGVGKSSLMRNMCGLLFPTAGKCETLNFQAKDRLPEMLQNLFFLAEEIALPPVKIQDFLANHAHFYANFEEEQFLKYLDEFGISWKENLAEISYGQQKKVAISFGLATNAQVILMDEPTNGLDIPSKAIFRKIMASAIHENRLMIISTHQVQDLDNLIDAITIIENRQVLVHETLENLSKKYAFKIVNQVEDSDKILYAENAIKGSRAMVENTDFEDTKVDLEMLFNAVIANPNKFITN